MSEETMPEARPVLLLPGRTSAGAADEYFSDIYDCASWLDGDLEESPKPYSNGELKRYAGRNVTVWGAQHNFVKADSVLSELLNLKCTVRYIDLAKHSTDPWVARASEMPMEQLFAFMQEHSSDITQDPITHMQWRRLKGLTPPERKWAISHWLTGGATLFAGRGGIGKTHVAQTIATALALGKPYLDAISEPLRVLFWACEDDESELWRRQISITNHFGSSFDDLDNLIIEPRVGLDNGLFVQHAGMGEWREGLRSLLREQVNDYKADVLILDNIGQIYGGNENDRHHVTSFVGGLMGLTQRSIPIVLLGHPAKAAESEWSGSTAWEAAVRMRWYMGTKLPDQKDEQPTELEAEASDGVRFLCKRKANYTKLDFRQLTWQEGVYECAIPEHVGPTFRQKYAGAARMDYARGLILGAVKQFFDAGIRVTSGQNSPDYVLNRMREIKICQDYTNSELREALMALRLEGKIIEAPVGKYGNRSRQLGLAPLGST